MSRFALALGLLLASEASALSATIELDRKAAFENEQVQLQVRVTHEPWQKPRWEAPVIEGAWTERLPTQASKPEYGASGQLIRTSVFRRALFPTRTGTLEIPASRLLHVTRGGEQQIEELPKLRLKVRGLPRAGRPSGFRGLVGQLALTAQVPDTQAVLGKAIPLRIEAYGTANLFDLQFEGLELVLAKDAEVFPGRVVSTTGERAGKLTMRRTFPFELVPRGEGALEVPALVLPYFDTGSQSYKIARSEPLTVSVVASRKPTEPWQTQPVSASEAPATPGSAWLTVAFIGGLVTLLLTRWWRKASRRHSDAPRPIPSLLLNRAIEARETDRFYKLLSDTLRAAIHVRHRVEVYAASSREIVKKINDPVAATLLRSIDEARFGGAEVERDALLGRVREYVEQAGL